MKKFLMECNCAEGWGEWAMTALRVVTGVIFLMHGWMKYSVVTVGSFSGYLESLNVPMPDAFAYIVIAVEIIGGIALILGAFTHWAAKLTGLVALFAMFLVHVQDGFYISIQGGKNGYEFVLLLLVACLVIMTHGGGKYSLDHTYLRKMFK